MDEEFDERSKEIFAKQKSALQKVLGPVYQSIKVKEDNFTWIASFDRDELEISIEADAHWINFNTGFGVISEVPISARTNIEKVCESVANDVADLLKFGCTKVDTFNNDTLVSSSYYVNGRQLGAKTLHKIRLIGKKRKVETHYSFHTSNILTRSKKYA